MKGSRITGVATYRGGMRFPFPPGFAARLTGHRIKGIKRRAKYLIFELDGDEALLIHLGMSGRLVLEKNAAAPRRKHDHVIFFLSGKDKKSLRFNDPRRFGLCDIVAKKDLPRHKLLKNLGLEPLGGEFTASRLEKILRGKKTSIKAALMDQRVIAGLGNIYACEALFYAGIDPRRRAGTCSSGQIRKLAASIRKVLRKAIMAGGSSLRDYVRADGTRGLFQNQFAVYGKEGKSCPGCSCGGGAAGGGIKRIVQGGRSTFYCPHKQV